MDGAVVDDRQQGPAAVRLQRLGDEQPRVIVPTRADADGIVLAEIEISHRSVETFGR